MNAELAGLQAAAALVCADMLPHGSKTFLDVCAAEANAETIHRCIAKG